jgi:small neutral amino acid transporter SnatA (MarC family)
MAAAIFAIPLIVNPLGAVPLVMMVTSHLSVEER